MTETKPGIRTQAQRDALAEELILEIAWSKDAKGSLPDLWAETQAAYDLKDNRETISLAEGMTPRTFPILKPKVDRITGTVCGALFGIAPYVQAVPLAEVGADGQEGQSVADFLESDVHDLAQQAGIDQATWDLVQLDLLTNHGILRVSTDIHEVSSLPEKSRAKALPILGQSVCVGYKPETVHPGDFVLYPALSRTISQAKTVGHRFWMRLAEVREYQKRGIYLKTDEELIGGVYEDTPGTEDGNDQMRSSTTPDWTPIGDKLLGAVEGQGDDAPVELYELITKRDLDGDGLEEYYLAVVAPAHNVILSVEPYPHSRPWYFTIGFVKNCRGGFWQETSVGQALRGMQQAATDFLHIYTSGIAMSAFGTMLAQQGLFPHGKQKFGPGEIVEINGPIDQIKEWKITFDGNFLPQALALFEDKADAITGISRASGTGQQLKPNTTATEAQQLQMAQQAAEGRYLSRLNMVMGQEVYPFLQELYAYDFTSIKYYYGPSLKCQTVEDAMSPVRWEPNGKTVGNTPQALREKLNQALELAMMPGSMYDPLKIQDRAMKSIGLPFNTEGLKYDQQQLMAMQQQAAMQGGMNGLGNVPAQGGMAANPELPELPPTG